MKKLWEKMHLISIKFTRGFNAADNNNKINNNIEFKKKPATTTTCITQKKILYNNNPLDLIKLLKNKNKYFSKCFITYRGFQCRNFVWG